MLMRTMLPVGVTVGVLALILLILLMIQPEWLLSGLRKRSPEVLYSVDTQTPVVALTIDDGPDSTSSPLILDVLEKYDAHATFFLISEHIPGNEEIVRQMIAEGHELGNHLTADEPSIGLPLEEFEQDLIEADEILSEFTDVQWVRPGSGWYNEEMLAIMEKHGFRCALGSVYPYDPQIGFYWYSAQYVLWKVKPGAVVVLHDYDTRGYRTAKALEIILPELEERGYRVVTLSELIEIQAVED
jgi:peptidoglycan/xylan/chitin deacetylase (PgdA/CDA1 family)